MQTQPSLLDHCFDLLGGETGPGHGLCYSRTSFERFQLLQTPELWGHDPRDNTYWLDEPGASGVDAPSSAQERIHPAGRRFLDAIETIIAEAKVLVDLSSLESFPTGHFLTAIERGLTRLAASGRPATVRFLFGVHPFTRNTNQELAEFVTRVTRGVEAERCRLRIFACRHCTSNEGLASSWNHAKIVASDGKQALVGGHNLWSPDNLGLAPVHDLSAVFVGPGAIEAHLYLDRLWDWTAKTPESAPPGPLNYTLSWYQGRIEPGVAAEPGVPMLASTTGAAVPALAVSRFGSGIVATSEVANLGAGLVVAACRLAQKSIKFSQMDLAFHYQNQSYWPRALMAELANALTEPKRNLRVQMVLSEPGGVAGSGGPYSFGETIEGIVQEFQGLLGGRTMTGTFELTPLRISDHADRWTYQGQEWKMTNHAKLWMVDDSLFHIGSDNIYPHNLQEFGYVVESRDWSQQILDEYWNPMWKFSSRKAISVGG